MGSSASDEIMANHQLQAQQAAADAAAITTNFNTSSSFPIIQQSLHPSSSSLVTGRNEGGDGRDDHAVDLRKLRLSVSTKAKIEGRKKVREPRLCVKIMSPVDVLSDGFKWRKYGERVAKNTLHPRHYYRCTHDNCRVKKRIERSAEDPRMVVSTYQGRHHHAVPRDNLEETYYYHWATL